MKIPWATPPLSHTILTQIVGNVILNRVVVKSILRTPTLWWFTYKQIIIIQTLLHPSLPPLLNNLEQRDAEGKRLEIRVPLSQSSLFLSHSLPLWETFARLILKDREERSKLFMVSKLTALLLTFNYVRRVKAIGSCLFPKWIFTHDTNVVASPRLEIWHQVLRLKLPSWTKNKLH